MTWWNHKAFQSRDGVICDGSVRSGKTLSMTVGFFLWSMFSFQESRFALCGKTIETLRRNVIWEAPRWLEGVLQFQEKRSENRITVTEGSKYWFNCNPEGPEHWFYREWIQQWERKNLLYLHFTMADNPALAPSVRARYEATYTGVFYDRYVRGLWVAAEGLIYDMFRPEVHLLRQAADCVGGCYISCDYGTRNPTVFLLWRKLRGADRWVCQREYYWDGRREMRQKTDGEYADDLLTLLDGETPRGVVVDPSAASFITELRQRGLPVLPGDNRVADGIRAVGELLRGERLLFQAECVHTATEFRSYVWDEKNAAQGMDKPVKEHDHCMDAVRYFVMTVVQRESARARRRPRGL